MRIFPPCLDILPEAQRRDLDRLPCLTPIEDYDDGVSS